jgi:hypothetical protein
MLQKTDVIDLVTRSKDGRQYDLVLVVDAGEWQRKNALHALQEKINSYASYALDGAMAADYPESAGRSKALVIQTIDVPPDEAVQFLVKVETLLKDEGLPLRLERLE